MTLFSNELRAHRRREGIDHAQIATSSRVDPARLWRIEEGLERPGKMERRRIMIAARIPESRAKRLEWVSEGA